MKYLWLFLLVMPMAVFAQKYDTAKMNRIHEKWLAEHPYWTVWFYTNSCDSNFYDPKYGTHWVQSYDDSLLAYAYYWTLKAKGSVKIWGKMKCSVDTASVVIDKYDMILKKYIGIKQPSPY